jgi:cytochrome c biogenesis protein CcmG/thiol:disulfide interchange protein DsbE
MRRYLFAFALMAFAAASGSARAAEPGFDLAQYRGKVVYLDFWASWCKPCRHSFPWMNAMQQKYGADGLVIVAVNVDEQHADAEKFLKETPAGFTVIYDPAGKLAEQYGIYGMPSSFVIGRDGQVLQKHQGFFDDSPAKYEAELRAGLGKQ